ncbi:YcgN family cysteine cluster protein [Rhodoblastus acidophilus]|uniref:YcgN family cysteine cluster protein n=1 Tax=Rhodoblastus acidophilus TaxID=1074 RepID=UPI000B50C4D7|nr:YcgN family cysteine cluster protein [Rhodoblastus acidophilus]MCW2315461.1 putative cysteine cluster protein YcgN (CxxCxxCC family) [Rhodoblastus acidophilus]PPQ40793.1 YcgN family cysteine cluster protein [Rhodoblastus acidophilus]RAI21922.1 YcgN family cysteine cluster protein [Rhodoblastus acidophilus]
MAAHVPRRRAGRRNTRASCGASFWDRSEGVARKGGKFWLGRALTDLSKTEWESLCDGCGRCCLVKLQDEDTGEIYFTDVGCRLLDPANARCADYGHRSRRVKDCIKLDPDSAATLDWLPPTCAYRLIARGQDLPDWHPLVSGRPESVIEAGVSVIGRVYALEDALSIDEQVDRVVSWPGKVPKAAKKK